MAEPAPLIAIPQAPIPSGAAPEWVEGAGGARLRAALFRPEGAARGSVVLSGGRTEPIEKYFEVIGELTARGFVVLAHDWRGQGLSHRALQNRMAGHAAGYEPFLADYRALLDAFDARMPKPWIAVGHSMGGCLTLLALAKGEARRFLAAVLSAPMLGLQLAAPVWLVALLARLAGLLGRSERFVLGGGERPEASAFETNILTHDAGRFARNAALLEAAPELGLGAPTWGWVDFALRARKWIANPRNLQAVDLPVTICQAGEEKLVDNRAQAAAAKALPRGRLVEVHGARHEILMETDEVRAVFWEAFDDVADTHAPRPRVLRAPRKRPAAGAKAKPERRKKKPSPSV